jgi:hypothetical protein
MQHARHWCHWRWIRGDRRRDSQDCDVSRQVGGDDMSFQLIAFQANVRLLRTTDGFSGGNDQVVAPADPGENPAPAEDDRDRL